MRAVTGDIGILMAAVRGLETTERRRAALLRHIWRPKRFRALLDRFAGRAAVPAGRVALLERLATGAPEDLIAQSGASGRCVQPRGHSSRKGARSVNPRSTLSLVTCPRPNERTPGVSMTQP